VESIEFKPKLMFVEKNYSTHKGDYMSVGLLERVKEFLVRLVKDQAFRSQLENSTIDERNKFLQDAGYNFSKEEFETATIQVLDLKEQGKFTQLSEEELVAAVGGLVKNPPHPQPLYGVVRKPWPTNPIDNPIVQPMYGVIAPLDEQ